MTLGEYCDEHKLDLSQESVNAYMQDEFSEGLYKKSEPTCGCDGSRPCKTDGAGCVNAWRNGHMWVPFPEAHYGETEDYPEYISDANDTIICPYCGQHSPNANELFRNNFGGDTEETCENCLERFSVTQYVEVSYITRRMNGRKPLSPARFVGEGVAVCRNCGSDLNESTQSDVRSLVVGFCDKCLHNILIPTGIETR